MNTLTTHLTPTPRLSRSELKVLLVDDDLFVLDLISGALRNLGITHVTQASSGQQALEILGKKQQDFDLLLLDCKGVGNTPWRVGALLAGGRS